jgi:hypothetical protein
MPVALPAGWLEVSTGHTLTLACAVELRAQVGNGLPPGLPALASDAVIGYGAFADWSLYVRPAAGAVSLGCSGAQMGIMQGYDAVELILADFSTAPFDPANHHVLATGATSSCTNPNWLGPVTATLTVANLRLGVTIETTGGLSYLRYAWFSDASTTETLTIGAFTLYTRTYSDPPALYGPQGLGPYLKFYRDRYGGAPGSSSVHDHVRFSSFTANGSALSTPGTLTFKAITGSKPAFFLAGEVGLPFQWRGDVDADDSSGLAVAADATYSSAVSCPATVDRTVEQYFAENIGGSHSYAQQYAGTAVLADPWLSAQTVVSYSTERAFTLEGNKPKTPAAATPGTFDVGTVTITNGITVLLSSNAWTVDAGSATVGGTSTVPVFTVTSGPATVRRSLLSHWRNWNTGGDPLEVSGENYTATKRNAYSTGAATPDVWGWGAYAYLDADITPGAAATLTFEVTWAVVRQSGAIVTVVRNYSATWSSGARATKRLDLLFPTEAGHPFYGERVDMIRISGLPVGTVTVHSLTLTPVEQAYLKAGGVRKVLADGTVTTGGITLAQDGQMAVCHWGQDPTVLPSLDRDGDAFIDHQRDHQNGRMAYGSSATAIPSDESMGGAIGMVGSASQTIQNVMDELNRLEGVTATYSATALDSDLTDSFGNSIGITGTYPTGTAAPVNRSSLWLKPVLPHARLTAGAAYTMLARLVVDDVSVPTGRGAANVRVFQRQHLGSVLEAQCVDSAGNRAAAGATVTARVTGNLAPSASDASLNTGMTDASGFVTIPVRNGLYSGAEPLMHLTG